MFNFDKDLFIAKVKKHGFEIIEYGKNAFELPGFFVELPELKVSCAYDGNNTISILATLPISENVTDSVIPSLCDKLNSIAKFYTWAEGGFIASGLKLDFSEISYSDDNDALEYAAVFVLMFKQEFGCYGIKAYQYANTGNINYLVNY